MKKRGRRIWGFVLLFLLVAVFLLWNLHAGSVSISAAEIRQILLGRSQDSTKWNIIRSIRLPRLLSALILGGALSVSGYLLQTFFHNPIAGPFVLGISSGAKLTVSITMIFLLSRGMVSNSATLIFSAFFGAMISMGFVLIISQRVKQMSLLVVCGVMIGYICSALTDFFVTFADDSNIVNLHNWSVGSFSGRTWTDVRALAIVCALGVGLSFLLSKPIRAYQLGEVYAQNMGVHLRAFRTALIVLSSILSATVTAFAGPISFVGIAVPFLILGIPIFDISFAFLRRIAHGQNPMKADRGHFHHRLIDMGFSQKQAVAIAYMLTGILGLAAVLLTSSGELKALILIAAIFIVGAIGMRAIFGAKEPTQEQKSEQPNQPEDASSASQEEKHAEN